MIIARTKGGIGNQMFQYAFGLITAQKLGTQFIIDPPHNYMITSYFKSPFWERWLWQNIRLRNIRYRFIKKINLTYTNWDNCETEYANIKPINGRYYDGYFQSAKLIQDNFALIKDRFDISTQNKKVFKNKYGNLFSKHKILTIHIRRGDYLKHGKGKNLGSEDLSLPISYYRKCLGMTQDITDYKIIVMGDDMEYARKEFRYLNPIFSYENEITDFQFILHSNISIISNSTFAWWAAVLNKKNNKKIYAPKYWLGFQVKKEYPVGITPICFNTIENFDLN